MAEEAKLKIEDLPGGAQELEEGELDKVVGGIKDGTSNTLMVGNLVSRPRPRSSDPDSGDEFV